MYDKFTVKDMILLLEKKSVPYYLRKKLEKRYFFTGHHNNIKNIHVENINYNKKTQYLFSKDWIKQDFLRALRIKEKEFNTKDIIYPQPYQTSFKEIADEIAIYFRQALDFFRTAVNMPINTAPLVEYYGLLQCVKGSILMTLSLKKPIFFNYHGLKFSEPSNPDDYIKAEVKPGIFPALLIRHTYFNEEKNQIFMEEYLKKNYNPSLKNLINDFRVPSVFIVSWMLSSLVRYKPKVWQEICAGEENELITEIQEFRRAAFPKAVKDLLW